MSLKAKIEAIIYAAENPVTLDQITQLVKDSISGDEPADVRSQVRATLDRRLREIFGAQPRREHLLLLRKRGAPLVA